MILQTCYMVVDGEFQPWGRAKFAQIRVQFSPLLILSVNFCLSSLIFTQKQILSIFKFSVSFCMFKLNYVRLHKCYQALLFHM